MIQLQNSESQTQYANYMKQFVCYTLQIVTAHDEKDESHEKNEENEKNDEKKNLFHDVWKFFFWHSNQKQLAVKM